MRRKEGTARVSTTGTAVVAGKDAGRGTPLRARRTFSLTTLQLARVIATAVLRTRRRPRRRNSMSDPATQAVLDTLRREGMWFMRT